MRQSRDEYYLNIAKAVASGSECLRSQVGCVIVNKNKIISTGYNGYPPGDRRECESCPRYLSKPTPGEGSYEGCMGHAELNGLLRASWSDLDGAVVYLTRPPCHQCKLALSLAPITRVCWPS